MVRRKPGPNSKGLEPAKKDKPDNAFDTFLDRGLHSMFDSIKDEPVPEELLRIIEEDRKA